MKIWNLPYSGRKTDSGGLPSFTAQRYRYPHQPLCQENQNNEGIVRLHGAVTRVFLHTTAFPLRTEGFAYGIASSWNPNAGPNRSATWVARTAANLAPFGQGAYVNVMDREDEASVRKAYAENYQRLAKVKARYDPSNVFAINQNIKPAT